MQMFDPVPTLREAEALRRQHLNEKHKYQVRKYRMREYQVGTEGCRLFTHDTGYNSLITHMMIL